MTGQILFKRDTSQIGRLIIDHPARRNAITAGMWADIPDVLDKAAKNADLRVLVVTGAGEHFAAGADISEFETLYATVESATGVSAHIAAAMDALAAFPLPTVAEICGACVGGGCGLALCCDIRLADSTAKFAITPGKLGLVYPFRDIQRLVNVVGLAHARDILFSARLLDAEEAARIGLINRLLRSGHLREDVRDYTLSIAGNSRESALVTKHMFALVQSGQTGESEQTRQAFLKSFASGDFREGYRAFLEKRKPDFS
ncbi:MAG: enoyl-CoA hydratase/isomerase family protein [Hyphomonadaceae bacterium]|nr:enoyl-CoA hydratase/isomerase family protein [Hyphomonadaceae bacterium]MBC6411970.1 enoyl-CoA hydratase/isomerase family protein [Hyphomonadaceae bacterium]